MSQTIDFIKHNNAVPIILFILFGITSASFASEDVRNAMYTTTQEVTKVDNTYIIGANIKNRDFKLRITDVKEDAGMYYVAYTYKDISIVDHVWKEVTVTGELKVAKRELEGGDLGLFVAKQLGELMEGKRAYLSDVQAKEKTMGATPKVVATTYSGIIGKYLDSKEQEFPGYAAVIEPVASTYNNPVPDIVPPDEVEDSGERSVSYPNSGQVPLTQAQLIEQLVAEQVRAILAGGSATSTLATTTDPIITRDEEEDEKDPLSSDETLPTQDATTTPSTDTATSTPTGDEPTTPVSPEPVEEPAPAPEPAPEPDPEPEPAPEPEPEPTAEPQPLSEPSATEGSGG